MSREPENQAAAAKPVGPMDDIVTEGGRPGRPEGPNALGPWVRLASVVALTVALIGLTVLLFTPFLPAIAWAVALAILAWPLHRRIEARVSNAGVGAGLTTAVVTLTLLAVGAFLGYQLVKETSALAAQVEKGAAGEFRERLAGVPVVGRGIVLMERLGVEVEDAARTAVGRLAEGTSGVAQGSAVAAIQSLVAVFILFYLLRDRRAFLDAMHDLIPLPGPEADFLMKRAADSVQATLYATIVTALIDSVALGLTFWATGLPAPVLWGMIMLILSVLPVLGAGMVWVPATIYLGSEGNWLGAAAMAVVGLATATLVDNLYYARLAGGRMRIHDVPVLVSFLGGLAVFGVSGMILGPAILAVTEAILQVWRRRIALWDRGVAPRVAVATGTAAAGSVDGGRLGTVVLPGTPG